MVIGLFILVALTGIMFLWSWLDDEDNDDRTTHK
jgi:hypothetical protein